MVFARHSEEIDYLKDSRREDRVVLIGMKSAGYPAKATERKEFLASKLREFIESITGEVVFDVYIRQRNSPVGDFIPPFELKFPSRDVCLKFRRVAYRKAQEIPELASISFHPSISPASRVRVEILRAISRKLTKPELSGYCPIYSTRPVLHVGPLVDSKVQTKETLTFVDAVMRYRHLITIKDLGFAYTRVGGGFRNTLSQNFIVLNDQDRANAIVSHTNTQRGNKRKENFSKNDNSKKSK